MSEPITIGYGTNKWIKDASNKMIGLYHNYVGNGFQALNLNFTAVPYQVPVGKKLIVLNIRTSYSDFDFYINGTIGGTTGGKRFHTGSGSGSYGAMSHTNWDCYMEVPAGNYINTYITSNSNGITLIGVEVDA